MDQVVLQYTPLNMYGFMLEPVVIISLASSRLETHFTYWPRASVRRSRFFEEQVAASVCIGDRARGLV